MIMLNLQRELQHSKGVIIKKILIAFAISLLVCWIGRNNDFGTQFDGSKITILSLSLASFFIGLSNSIAIFSMEKAYVQNRIYNKQTTPAQYVHQKIAGQAVIAVLQSLIMIVTVKIILKPETIVSCSHETFVVYLVLFSAIYLTMLMGVLMGLTLSISFDIKFAMAILPGLLVAALVFSKAIFQFDEKSLFDYISLLLPIRYAVQIMCQILKIENLPSKIELLYNLKVPVDAFYNYSRAALISGYIHLCLLILPFPMIAKLGLQRSVYGKAAR